MLFFGVVLIGIAFVVFGISVVIRPQLPLLHLAAPQNNSRGASNVVTPEVPGNRLAIIFDRAAFAAQNKQSTTHTRNQASKMLGFYVNWDENSLTSLKQNIDTIDILVPEWLHLSDGDGNITIDNPERIKKTLQVIRENKPDLEIVPLINNFNDETQGWDRDMLKQVLRNETSRRTLITKLLAFVTDLKFSGISIDFEDVPKKEQPNLTLFMQELSAEFHKTGLHVSQNIPLEDESFNATELGKSADFLILMAYDENTAYGSTAGPVASQGWFVKAVAKRFKELPSEKYIIAIGGYGYDWIDDSIQGMDISFGSALQTAQDANATIVMDAVSLNSTYSYYDDENVLHHAWFLDAVTVFNQIQASNVLGTPYGYALWRLGSEDPSLWNIVPERDALDANAASSLKRLRYSYDVGYKGDGEVLKVTGTPQEGEREVSYDTVSGLIVNESIVKFPSPYIITRFGGTRDKRVVLTFDDGPNEKYTPPILDILKRYNVPATFFVMGLNASANPDILKRIVAEGNEIGNHTYTHPDISAITKEQFRIEIDATERLFEGLLGRKSLLLRPPYAEDIEPVTPEQVAPLALSSDLGYYTVGINIDPTDWKRPGADVIAQTVIEKRRAGVGNVVLMHDSGGDRSQTIEALPKIIETLQADGYQFVTVSDILGISKDEIMPLIGSQEKGFSYVNKVAFFSLYSFTRFLSFVFVLGIFLGITRILFIGILAVIQYFSVKKKIRALDIARFQPQVVVIIPAFNEEKVVVRTVRAILSSTYKRFHIIVVDDGSTDNTFKVLQEAFGEHSNVDLFTKKNEGKSAALNFGITQTAKADAILVTLDADTIFQPNTIEKLIRRFADPGIAAIAGNAKVGNRVNILTKWQALEYITSQNLDRRAFELMNCISVVPGSVGAWRKDVVLEVGGFTNDTLAEDADLTFSILRLGYHIAYEDEALAFTEAPDTVKDFIKQRYRWMFGTMQTAWKHKEVFFRKRYGALGFFAIPNIFVFQVFFTLISPFMDLAIIFSLIWVGWQKYQHPIGYDAYQALHGMLMYYLLFLAVDMTTSFVPFLLERKEQLRLIFLLPLQRFFYRQLMYYVAIKSTAAAIKGTFVRWGKLERKDTSQTDAMGGRASE
jgi:cellulose synthase/poly-beta-1,6-N-acetylglucosamine synthase-like glycosyltransferase/peptidoglycan/xylan/chitin deacetylase (PgdA/CDA1 family)/spore germination protein YaaH